MAVAASSASGCSAAAEPGEDLRDRVGDIFAGDIRCGTARRLVQAKTLFIEAGGRQHTHRAGDHRALVGEDVAKQVGAQQHVELGRIFNQLHGGVIDIHMRQLNVRILLADLADDFAPQDGGLQNVGLIDGSHFVTTLAGGFKSDARDTLDLKAVIHLGIKGFLMLTAAFAAFRLAEVDAAGQFAYAENVEAVSSDVGAQRAELFQPLIQFGRAQVAEQFKVFTQRQQRATLWLFRRRQVLPFRTADGAEQDRIRLLASGDGRLRQGVP